MLWVVGGMEYLCSVKVGNPKFMKFELFGQFKLFKEVNGFGRGIETVDLQSMFFDEFRIKCDVIPEANRIDSAVVVQFVQSNAMPTVFAPIRLFWYVNLVFLKKFITKSTSNFK